MTEQLEVLEVESTEEEQADYSASEREDDLLEILTSNVASLDEGSLFLLSVVRRDSADQSRLIQDSSFNYVAIVTIATTSKMFILRCI